MSDISLYVPWKDLDGMEKELDTLTSIHKKNLQEFCQLSNCLKKNSALDVIRPIEIGRCNEIKLRYINEEIKNMKLCEQCTSEYDSLLEKESHLLQETNGIRKRLKKLDAKLNELEGWQDALKKSYEGEKKSKLNTAKEVYAKSFGLDVTVENECDDIFEATVTFGEANADCSVKLTINKISNQILDFDASSFIPSDQLEQLKAEFKQTSNCLALITTLRKLAMNSSMNIVS